MKHLILFENYFNRINEAVENMKSGAKLYIGEKETKTSPNEMIASLDNNKASIQFFNQANGKIATLTFSGDLEASYLTQGGFGTQTVKTGGKEIKGAGLIYSSKKMEGEGDLVTVPYQGKSDADFSAALLSFLSGSGGIQNFDIAKMAVNTIYELVKTYKDKTPESLKRTYIQLERAIKLQDVNILAGTTENEKTLNKKLKSSLKAFVAKLA